MSAVVASVIVTTYNRPAALRAVLEGLASQSRRDFEVIIADDGSGPETREVVDVARTTLGDRLVHVWQEDRGFRAAAARNRAVERAGGSTLCFLDGDCVPRSHFVDGLLRNMRPGRLLRGSRVLLDEAFTERCERGDVRPHALGKAALRALRRAGSINRTNPLRGGTLDLIRVAASRLRPRNWRLLRGCNFAVPAEAFRAVRGFDESFEGWGFEDSDLCIRLMNLGLRIERAPAASCVLHLWHREQTRVYAGQNLERLQATIRSGRTLPMDERRRSTRSP